MAARSKATAVTSTAVEIHRVEKPGGILAIYERHDDGTVTRRVDRDVRVTHAPDLPQTITDVLGGGGAA